MKLTQAEKNRIYYALLDRISRRCKDVSRDVLDHHTEYICNELGEVREDLDVLDKLGKDGWAMWEDEE